MESAEGSSNSSKTAIVSLILNLSESMCEKVCQLESMVRSDQGEVEGWCIIMRLSKLLITQCCIGLLKHGKELQRRVKTKHKLKPQEKSVRLRSDVQVLHY